jgi:hypothetical protein
LLATAPSARGISSFLQLVSALTLLQNVYLLPWNAAFVVKSQGNFMSVKKVFLGATLALGLLSNPVLSAQIGIADFSSNAILETYQGLPLLDFNPNGISNVTPLVIGGNTYTTDNSLIRYANVGSRAGGSGYGLVTGSDLGYIDILFGTAVNLAGIGAGLGEALTWKVEFFVGGSLLASVTQSTLGPGVFIGWDAGTEKITSLRVTDLSDNNRTITVDNLRTEIVSPVPLPAALPLFAAGLSAMGFMGWRRKRRAA